MNSRARTILTFALFLVLLILLAASLNNLTLQDGIKFDFETLNQSPIFGGTVGSAGVWPMIIQAIMVITALLVPVYVVYMLIDKRRRKRLLFDLIFYGILLFILNLVRESVAKRMEMETPNLEFMEGEILLETPMAGTPVPLPPVPTDLTVTLTAILVGVASVLLFALFWVIIIRRRRPEPTVMAQLAEQAEETIDALITGQDLRSTILLCYRRMTEIAAKTRNLPREAAVTPHEFETMLVTHGLPVTPVHELTRLFEDVRYGDLVVGDEERKRAVNALRVIAAVCRPEEQSA